MAQNAKSIRELMTRVWTQIVYFGNILLVLRSLRLLCFGIKLTRVFIFLLSIAKKYGILKETDTHH